MAQNFVYGANTVIDTVHQIGLEGVPSMSWRDSLFGSVFKFDSFARKAASVVDVLCVQPFKTGFYLEDNYPSFTHEVCNRQWVDISRVRAYAIDPMLNVRRWSEKSFWGVKDSDDFCYNFARQIAKNYGKVAIVDTPSTTCENGRFSVFFPSINEEPVVEEISKETGISVFQRELTDFLDRIKAKAVRSSR